MRSSAESPVIGVGELLWDLLPSGARLGGTTANFAILSARLGNFAALISRVGRDALGKRAVAQLEGLLDTEQALGHLCLRGVQQSETLATGTVGVTLDPEGRPQYTIVQPVAWDEIAAPPQLMAMTAKASAICFGTLAQRQEPSRSAIRALVEATQPACIRVCDANLRMPFCDAETLAWCVRHATVLKISDEELPEVERLLGIGGDVPVADGDALTAMAQNSARALLGFAPDCRLVAITLGPHGSLLVDREGEYRHPGFAVEVADTIGAGDAFTAGLVHAFVRGGTLEAMSHVSNLCGSFVASRPGATPEFPAELLRRIHALVG